MPELWKFDLVRDLSMWEDTYRDEGEHGKTGTRYDLGRM